MKPLLPTLREKKRYIAYEVLSDKAVSAAGTSAAITRAVKRLMGELQAGKASPQLLSQREGQRGIMKVNREYVNHIRAAFTLITAIDGTPAMVRSTGVSGMLNKTEKRFMGG